MSEESKIDDPAATQQAAKEVANEIKGASVESESEDELPPAAEGTASTSTTAAGAAAKKKKSKRKRIKAALGGGSGSSEASGSKDDSSKLIGAMNKEQIGEMLKMNPSLAQQLGVTGSGDVSGEAVEALKRLKLEDIMSGLASSGKNVKDMGSYKFWQTQPVPKFGDSEKLLEEGPFKVITVDQVQKDPGPLVDGFEWVTMDMTSDEEIDEVFTLLYGHYVEDDEAMFRFNYSKSFLKWYASNFSYPEYG